MQRVDGDSLDVLAILLTDMIGSLDGFVIAVKWNLIAQKGDGHFRQNCLSKTYIADVCPTFSFRIDQVNELHWEIHAFL